VLRITVALPLSAGRMVRCVLSFNVLSAILSFLIRLSWAFLVVLMILTDSCLTSSAFSAGKHRAAFSIPPIISSMG
jgi:hypothetical protein